MSFAIERVSAPDLTVVTGASGWLGRSLVRAFVNESSPLRREGTIRVLVRDDGERAQLFEAVDEGEQVEVVVGDVSDPRTARQLLHDGQGASVVHAASVIHPPDTATFQSVNVEGTAGLVEQAHEADVRRFVYVSSNSPFGFNADPADTFRADEPYSPYMGYGRSKMEAELVVKSAAERGMDTAIVRPPWFYGPWQPERQTSFFRLVRRGRFPLLGQGRNRRSMVYIDNLIDGIDAADRVEAARGGAFWIADAEPYTMNEVIAAVRAALTVCGLAPLAPQRRLPQQLGALARFADGKIQSRGRYVQELHVLGEMDLTIACDIQRSRDVLGYEPTVTLLEGMIRSIQWCQMRGIEL